MKLKNVLNFLFTIHPHFLTSEFYGEQKQNCQNTGKKEKAVHRRRLEWGTSRNITKFPNSFRNLTFAVMRILCSLDKLEKLVYGNSTPDYSSCSCLECPNPFILSFRKGLFHFCCFLAMPLDFGGLFPLESEEIVLHITFCNVELLR